MPAKDPFQSIDPRALEHVSGGTAVATGASSTTASTGTTDPVLQLLTEVATELQALVQQQNGPSQTMQQMMMMMMTNAFAPRPTSGKGS